MNESNARAPNEMQRRCCNITQSEHCLVTSSFECTLLGLSIKRTIGKDCPKEKVFSNRLKRREGQKDEWTSRFHFTSK